MKPSDGILNKIISSLGPSENWNAKEEKQLKRLIVRIALANGGRIDEDAKLDQVAYDKFFHSTVETAIAKAMRERARATGVIAEPPYRLISSKGPSATWAMMTPLMTAPRIDINKASAKELAKLEALSPEQVSKIATHRKTRGHFAKVEELEPLIGAKALETIKPEIYASAPDQDGKNIDPAERRFINHPTFENCLQMMLSSETGKGPTPAKVKNKILEELSAIEQRLLASDHPRFNAYRVTRASEILRMKKIAKRAAELERQSSRDVAGVALLDQSAYLYFVADALAEARKRIRIVMFFMRFEEDKKHPAARLFDELEKAIDRGVDVKVILDKDDEKDVFGSRFINRNAFRFFVTHGVPVIFDPVNKIIHSKIVSIDDRHVIVGSHNWTVGSFFAYDDKSVYIESKEFASAINAEIDRMWRQYPKKQQVAHQLISTFDATLEGLRQEGVFTVAEFLSRTGSSEKRQKLSDKTGAQVEAINAARIKANLAALQQEAATLSDFVTGRTDRLVTSINRLPERSNVLSIAVGPHGRTKFYLLNADKKAEPLPARLARGETATLLICVENKEAAAIDYLLRIDLNSKLQQEVDLPLAAGEKREYQFTIMAEESEPIRAIKMLLLDRSDPKKIYGFLKLSIAVAQ